MILDSRISAVTVFLNRAKVTRTAKAELPAGESILVFQNIPNAIQPDSVRARGTGSGVRIVSLDVAAVQLPNTPDPLAGEVQQQVEDLELRLRELTDEQAAIDLRMKTTAHMRVSAATDLIKGLAWGRTNIDALEIFNGYVDKTDDAARAALRDLEVRKRALQRELDAAKARLKQLQHPASRHRKEVRVVVESEAPGTEVTLEISYVCSGATWKPLYDLRLTGETLQVTYLASVTQDTGEDWVGVDLALSTARPAATFSIPELSPWYLDIPRPPRPQASMARSAAPNPAEFTMMFGSATGEPLPAAPQAAAAPAPSPIQSVQAEVSPNEGGAAATFRIPRKASIPSDRTPHRVQIAEFDLPATLDYITAPKVAEQAYLRAKVRNDSPFVLLPGRANLFHGEEYVGATDIEDTAAAELELQMGVDERVTVCREMISREVSKTFIGNTRRAAYAYRIRISHRLPRKARIQVIDQLPHALHEDIKVKLQDIIPKASEQTEMSELRWQSELEVGRETTIQFGFVVEHPRHMTVLGLLD